jgi:hypothetical protein
MSKNLSNQSVYPADKYTFVKFRRSKNRNKKYDAVLKHKATGREKIIQFGAQGYAQYKDSTGLKLYSSQDHLDAKRRDRYLARHKGEGNATRKYSAGWFATNFLW